jgi:hypothetical protein
MTAVLIAIMVLSLVFFLRNEATYKARIAILHTSTPDDEFAGNALHDLLPTYDRMLFHPAFWLKWTEASWREYVGRQHGVAS